MRNVLYLESNAIFFDQVTFEQSANGNHIVIENTDIYWSENEGRKTCVWYDHLTVSNLVGNIDEKESLALIKAILGGT